jgi:hypothetical protein
MPVTRTTLTTFGTILVLISAVLHGQRGEPGTARGSSRSTTSAETAEIASGWALLAQGSAAEAAGKAQQVLARSPRSAAALTLFIEAEAARAGSASALTAYETWLGTRALEEAGVLRRIAQAVLREESAQQRDARARAEAVRALQADGERVSTRAEPRDAQAASTTRTDVAPGDEQALLNALKRGAADVRTIDAIGDSGNKAAVPLLIERLKDQRVEIRAAAVDAIAKLGDADVVPRLKPLLTDTAAAVRLRAAGALLRLGDASGSQVLQQFMTSPVPQLRLAAAEAMAASPDATWQGLVRELAAGDDPEIQARAARLLAPHDPDASRKVLESLGGHENPAIRDLASHALGELLPSDLSALRVLLRNTAPLPRVRVAARILEVTR